MFFCVFVYDIYRVSCRSPTCVDFEVRPEVAGVAEGLAAVFTLVRLHPHVSHEVHIEFGGGSEGAGTHAALELLLPHVSRAFRPGSVVRVSTIGAAAVRWSRSVTVTGPGGGGGGAGASVGKLLFLVKVLRLLVLLLLLLGRWKLLLLRVIVLRRAVAVRRLIMAAVTSMATKVSFELRKGRALFTTLTYLTLRRLRNT